MVSQMVKVRFWGSKKSKCIEQVVESGLPLVAPSPGHITALFTKDSFPDVGRGRRENSLPALMAAPPHPLPVPEGFFCPFSGKKKYRYLCMQ